MKHRFPKQERLHHKKVINTLFRTGKRWYGRCITLYYLALPTGKQAFHQALFSVPKSRYKKAIDRNKVKRRMKEAYRLHKHLLPSPQEGNTFLLGYVYKGKEEKLSNYETLLQDILSSIKLLSGRLT